MKMEDQYLKKIDALKKELEEKEKNLILAAIYGKDLLEQNAELNSKMEMLIQDDEKKIECLEQEKYSLSMKIEAKEKMINSLTGELESQERVHIKKLQKIKEENEDEKLKLNHVISAKDLEIESLEKKLQVFKEKSDSLEKLVENFQHKELEISFANSSFGVEEHASDFQHQIQCLASDKKDLEKEVINLKSCIKTAELNLVRNEIELKKKENELSSTYLELKRVRNENVELKEEIEQLKFVEIDPKKKGNSLFAELEDNRQELEKRVISLTSKLSSLRKQCDSKTHQIRKLKIDVASLLAMTSNASDMEYQKYLEDNLSNTLSQLSLMTSKFEELKEQVDNEKYIKSQDGYGNLSTGNYMEYLYKESQDKIKSLQEELRATCFSKVSLRDQNLQLSRKLYQSEKHREANTSEIIRLNVKIEELSSKNPTEILPLKCEIEQECNSQANHLVEKNKKKQVNFLLGNKEAENRLYEKDKKKVEKLTKPTSKLQAPIIKEDPDSPSSDCHVQ